ncbi:MAG: sodium-dependent transporter, partial [Ruminococcus sp.]|nr:sodium-dependent transporter [Ruminococcus sp.]
IAIYSLTLKYTDENGITRTGLQGLKVYLIPDFSEMTLKKFLVVVMDAMGQLFFSISVAMGIMVAYGSYAKKETNLMQSVNRIELFDTLIALIAGMMIVPAVFTFSGKEGMTAGPGLVFVSLPKVFNEMGSIGKIAGLIFFLILSFAAVTSSVSVMEAIVSSIMDKFGLSRHKSSLIVIVYTLITAVIVCFGYNILYFEVTLPNGTTAQILDIFDYISNYCMMPIVAFLTSVLIGWIVKPDVIIEEVTQGKYKFSRKKLYIVMIKYIVPLMLLILFLQATGIIKLS